MLGGGSLAHAELARQLGGGAGDGQAVKNRGTPETERRYEGALYIGS